MPSAVVLAAVQALDGAMGFGGGALSVLQYCPLQEPAGITTIYDGRSAASAGEWMGSPRLRGTIGPEENDTPSYAVTFGPIGGVQYGRLATGPQAMAALNGRGLFVCIAVKHASKTDRDPVLSASDPSGSAGFRISLNQGTVGEYSNASESAIFGTAIASGSVCTGTHVDRDLTFDDQWHLHMWFMKPPATVKHWIDGVPKPVVTSTSGTIGQFPTAGASLILGATTFGPYVDSSEPFAFNGALADMILIEGEPTQTQLRDICRAMYYTVRGVPGVVAHYRPGPDGAFSNTQMTTPSTEGGPILVLRDMSGHGNHARNVTASTSPTLERSINGGRWCASFDNFFSNYSAWAPDGLCRQQSLAVSPASTKLVQSHMGCLVTGRTLAGTCFAKGQKIIGFHVAAGLDYNSLRISSDEPCLDREAGLIFATDIPKVRCMPGLGILGFTSGLHGDYSPGDSLIFNNRWQSTTAVPLNSGTYATQYLTQWTIADWPGQMFFGGGQNMWAGWLEETIITRCPILPEEASEYIRRTFAEAGEPLNPKFHVCVVGDSIASGNRSDRLRTMLGGYLPVEARKVASFTNASVSGYRVRNPATPSASLTSRGLDSGKWWDAGAKNIAAVQAVVNDSIDEDTQATFSSDMDVLIPQLRAGGASVILWNEESSNALGPGPTPRNLAIRAHVADGSVAGSVVLTPLYVNAGLTYDGLHPTPAGQATWAGDWWAQGLSPYLRVQKTLSPTAGEVPRQ